MSAFIDLGESIFDEGFTLSPYDYLKDLYDRPEVLGFHSAGMNFLFRFEQAQAVIFNRDCVRAMGNNEELRLLEADYATRYPHRAWHFQHSYTHGEPDLKFKAAVGRLVAEVAEQASFAQAEPVFSLLSGKARLENYIDAVSTLPMRVFLEACRLPLDDATLISLHRAGCAFLKSLENFYDEVLIAAADEGLRVIREYVEEQFAQLDPESPLCDLVAAGHECGMSDEQIVANFGGMFLASISNTVGVSSAFILRSLLRDRPALQQLQNNPELVSDEHIIMELLRRDNHVKALSRQFNAPMNLNGFTIRAGEVLCLYFPGINMDHGHWSDPERLDFSRRFTGGNNIIFGGSFYTCIGRRLTMAFLKEMIGGFIRHLPDTALIQDEKIELDASWMAERIITRLPIELR